MSSNPPPVSQQVEERSRKNLTAILNRLGSVGQANVAKGLGLHETMVSKMKDKEYFKQVGLLLALLGLKAVPLDMKCYPTDQIDAIFSLAKARMEEMDSAEKLSFED